MSENAATKIVAQSQERDNTTESASEDANQNLSKEQPVKRYAALWKKTWFAWLAIGTTCAVISAFSHVFLIVFLVNIPIWIGMFFYFAHVRFDDNGEYRKQWGEP